MKGSSFHTSSSFLTEARLLDEVKAGLKEALEDYEYPVDIRVIEERPYFHFKTNRKELTEATSCRKQLI